MGGESRAAFRRISQEWEGMGGESRAAPRGNLPRMGGNGRRIPSWGILRNPKGNPFLGGIPGNPKEIPEESQAEQTARRVVIFVTNRPLVRGNPRGIVGNQGNPKRGEWEGNPELLLGESQGESQGHREWEENPELPPPKMTGEWEGNPELRNPKN